MVWWYGGVVLAVGMVAGAWAGLRALQRHVVRRAHNWAESLPFTIQGFSDWLADQTFFQDESYLWIDFSAEVPSTLVNDAVAAVIPKAAPQWFGETKVVIPLANRKVYTTHHTIRRFPDLKLLKRLMLQVLLPLHARYPMAQLSIGQLSAERYTLEQESDELD